MKPAQYYTTLLPLTQSPVTSLNHFHTHMPHVKRQTDHSAAESHESLAATASRCAWPGLGSARATSQRHAFKRSIPAYYPICVRLRGPGTGGCGRLREALMHVRGMHNHRPAFNVSRRNSLATSGESLCSTLRYTPFFIMRR